MPLVVKAHNPWKSRLLLAMLLLVLLLAGWALFEYGRFSAGYDSIEVTQESQVLLSHVSDLDDQIEKLREEKAVLERAAQIERKAYDELDTTLKVLQAEILELKEELAFYRGIVSPRQSAEGLHLQRFKIEANGKPRGYRYKVTLTQVLKNDRSARGTINMIIAGQKDEETKVLGLADVTSKQVKALEYSFRYFQNLEGDIQLPEGFKPLRVTVSVQPRNSRNQERTIEKTFDWPA
jgi:hypothetical protein